jgi:hypothetical protein
VKDKRSAKFILLCAFVVKKRRNSMGTIRTIIRQGILLICVSIMLIAGGTDLAWGDSSFTGVVPFDQQGFTVTPGMTDYDPRALIVNFGEPNEIKYASLSAAQDFDFDALLDAPVDHDSDSVESQIVPIEESADAHDQQPGTIPEPSGLVLLGLGLLLMVSRLWRKNSQKNDR